EVADVDRLVQSLLQGGASPGDCVVAIGGGSAIDLAKAAAALVTNQPDDSSLPNSAPAPSVLDYLEGVGRGLTITRPPLPLIVLPTTSGTGSEATKNAVINSYDPAWKKSMRSNLMVPRVALVDPELSVSVPPQTTAYTGMDAITQLIESYVCRNARPVPCALAVEGLRQALPAIVTAVRDGHSRPAREAMAHAALLSGIALANSGLGLAHGVAAALGSLVKVPHGLACAVMLPVALRVNHEVSQTALATLAQETLGVDARQEAVAAERFIVHIESLCHELEIPTRLAALGVTREQIPALVPASRGNSMNGNPRQLDDRELTELLESIW
ncbi:MAG: iron-containing alcohol dehydrogenase, partial [Planctomycetaceae bacterium]|nr:iron-containing alcohol dehydrogenase [Planctomycetaceae bacterium]